MRTEFTLPLTVHGNIGQEIRDVDGKTVAWTTDQWLAQQICEYVNGSGEPLAEEKTAEVVPDLVQGNRIDVGTDVWDCDGRQLTPQMRQDILMTVAEMYRRWEAQEGSYEWEWKDDNKIAGGVVLKKRHVVTTVSDLFKELTRNLICRDRWDPADCGDEFDAWLKDYLHDHWKGDHCEDDVLDPLMAAEDRVRAWLLDINLTLVRRGKTDIAIFLFGQPEYEFQEYELTGAGMREYASDLGKWLNEVADIVEKLRDDGWRVKVVANNLEATHREVNNCDEAVARLQQLGIDMDAIIDIAEWDDRGERLTPA